MSVSDLEHEIQYYTNFPHKEITKYDYEQLILHQINLAWNYLKDHKEDKEFKKKFDKLETLFCNSMDKDLIYFQFDMPHNEEALMTVERKDFSKYRKYFFRYNLN